MSGGVANGPPVNGQGGQPQQRLADTIDPDDPEYRRMIQRPAVVKEDIKGMEGRKRVNLILNSEEFREELQEIIESQIKSGPHPAALLALSQISDLLLPHTLGRSGGGIGRGSSAVVPINDLKGMQSMGYSKGERLMRCKLAALYRLVDINSWTTGIFNHITVRLSQDQEHFLLNPYGLLYHEVTASSLVKLNMQGEIIDPGSTTLGVNTAGFVLHSAIHAARPDIRCVIHVEVSNIVAVSCLKSGLLPLAQDAMGCGPISYHDFCGVLVDESESEQIARDLGPTNKIMFLRNHGVVVCGATVEEAWYLVKMVEKACDVQLKLSGVPADQLVEVPEDVQKKTHEVCSQGASGCDIGSPGSRKATKWKVGQLEFEAEMRQLDNAGYRTGYLYRQPVIRHVPKKSSSEVEIPPTASSYNFDGGDGSPQRLPGDKRRQQAQREHWLNTPNVYTKVEVDETGTDKPKKITKWLPGEGGEPGSPRSVTTTKTTNPNLFAPQGVNPKEFKQAQQKVRKNYYEDNIDAGPQSKILEGTTWEEARQATDGQEDGTVVVVGAASKGIIAREHQENATVYRTQYAPNPFNEASADDLEKYKQAVEDKKQGGEGAETGMSESMTSAEVPGSPDAPTSPAGAEESRDERAPSHIDEEGYSKRSGPPEMNTDDVFSEARAGSSSRRPKPTPPPRTSSGLTSPGPATVKRSESDRAEKPDALDTDSFKRSKSEMKKGRRGLEEARAGGPRSDSGADTLEEGSPTKSGKKKKKGLRLPSFNKKKKEEKEAKKKGKEAAV